jgi:hypothetical protein
MNSEELNNVKNYWSRIETTSARTKFAQGIIDRYFELEKEKPKPKNQNDESIS